MNLSAKENKLIDKNYMPAISARIATMIVALFLLAFFASSSVFAGTSLPSTPSGREGYYEFLGIDVSEWQGSIDWTAVKDDGVNYADRKSVV